MPPCNAALARNVKARWSTYLTELLRHDQLSRSAVARVLEVPVSRISLWLAGERLVTPESAFEIGEKLHEKLSLPTSGAEALYACGYFAELFGLLKHLSVDFAAEGDLLAVDLYCWLPAYLFPIESKLLGAQQRAIGPDGLADMVANHMREYWRLDILLDLRSLHMDDPDAEQLRSLTRQLRAPEARAAIAAAWQGVQSGRMRSTRAASITETKRRSGVTRAEEVRALLAGEPKPTALDFFVDVTSDRKFDMNWTENLGFVDAVIALARDLRSLVPSLAGPRLWRMLGEWASYVDSEHFLANRALLPHSFRTYEDREFTEEEAFHLDRLQDMRDRARGK